MYKYTLIAYTSRHFSLIHMLQERQYILSRGSQYITCPGNGDAAMLSQIREQSRQRFVIGLTQKEYRIRLLPAASAATQLHQPPLLNQGSQDFGAYHSLCFGTSRLTRVCT